MKPTYGKSRVGNLLMWSDLTLGLSFQGQMRIAKFKSAYNSPIIGPTGCNVKPTCMKSCASARNLLIGSALTWAPPSRLNEDSQS